MKILILANFGMGLYKFRKELIEELLDRNYKVYISLPNDNEYVPKLIEMGCEFIETNIERRGTNPINDFKLFLKYRKIIKNIKPNVVLTYTIKPNIYGGLACRISNVPYLPNITGLGSAFENSGILQKITLLLYKVSLKDASCVFFQNKENEEFFTRRNVIKGKRILLPGSGVNLNYYKLLDYPLNNNINFLFVSRVMKEKGIDQYLEAAIHIKNKYKNTIFHIVGFCEEEYEEKLKNMQEKGIIIFHGQQSDVRMFYEKSHCIVHPTYYPEGMSNVLLESAACGRPIITTNRSGCKEIVEEDVSGYIVEQKNSIELINKIEEFINLSYKDKKNMGLMGRLKVEKEFDRKLVVKSYCNEISRILSSEIKRN